MMVGLPRCYVTLHGFVCRTIIHDVPPTVAFTPSERLTLSNQNYNTLPLNNTFEMAVIREP